MVLPSGVDPMNDSSGASGKLRQMFANRETAAQPYIPISGFQALRASGDPQDEATYMSLQASIWNIAEGAHTVKLSNRVVIGVQTTRDLNAHVHAVFDTSCGAAGEPRVFPDLVLDATADSYKVNSTFAAVEYFTLEPGTHEEFRFPVRCRGVGSFVATLALPYEVAAGPGAYEIQGLTKLGCPKSFTVWSVSYIALQFAADSAGARLERQASYAFDNGTYRLQK